MGEKALLVGLLTSVVAVAFEGLAVATAMPAAAQELGQVGLYAWAFTLFVLGMTFATVVAGRLCDRRGPVLPLLSGLALFVVGLLLAGAAHTMLVLVVARFVQGLGGGAINLALMVIVAEVFDEQRRARIMTWFSVCWLLPSFVGPPISAAIARHWGWHWVFWGVVPLMVAAAAVTLGPLLALAARPRQAHPAQGPVVPLWAAAGAAIAIAGLQWAGQLLGWTGALLALAALALLVTSAPRLMPPRFWSVGEGLPAVVWTRLCQAGAFFAGESFLPLSWVEQRQLTLFEAGLVLTVGSIGWTAGSWVQSARWLHLARERLIVLGVAATAGGVALVLVSAIWPRGTLVLAVVGWTIAALGMGLSVPSTSLATMSLSGPHELGRNTSSLQVAEGLGNSLVTGLVGSLFHGLHAAHSSTLTFSAVFATTALVAVLGLAASLRIGRIPVAAGRG